jgi:hypothetical protein
MDSIFVPGLIQEVGFDLPDYSTPYSAILFLCALAVGLVSLGRRLRPRSIALTLICYALAGIVILLAFGSQ